MCHDPRIPIEWVLYVAMGMQTELDSIETAIITTFIAWILVLTLILWAISL